MTVNSQGQPFRFTMDMQRLKALGIVDPKSTEALAAYDRHELTSAERLFLKLWGSDLLNSGVFNPGQQIAARGEHPVFAHVIIAGEVVVRDPRGEMLFGPGSVFGLAEGLSDGVYSWDAVARTVVMTKVIPIDRALREVRRLNAGLKGICRFTSMRMLGLSTPPQSLS